MSSFNRRDFFGLAGAAVAVKAAAPNQWHHGWYGPPSPLPLPTTPDAVTPFQFSAAKTYKIANAGLRFEVLRTELAKLEGELFDYCPTDCGGAF